MNYQALQARLHLDRECVINTMRAWEQALSIEKKFAKFAQYRKNRKKCYQNPNGYSLMSRPKIGMFVCMQTQLRLYS